VTVARVFVIIHVPPLTVLVSVTVEPVHTNVGPEIVPAVGAALMVTAFVADAVPQELVTV
jgi:hypothetical protein